MDPFNHNYLADLSDDYEPPCISLYQPTHRVHPENQQDPIRFRNLLKAVEESIHRKYPTHEIRPLLEPFVALAEDLNFWKQSLDGLAILSARGMFRIYRLHGRVAELVVVADSFHTKPLMRTLQSVDRYQILGLTRQEITLFEGNRHLLGEIEPAQAVPRTMTEALGKEITEPEHTVASYGGTGPGQAPMHHGHGGKSSEVDIDTERFFRAVDREVTEHHSQPSNLPLILATLPEHGQLFRQVSHNPYLIDAEIHVQPDAVSVDELRQRAWEILEPRYLARVAALVEQFGTAEAQGLGDGELAPVAKAVSAGRVATLLIEANREIPGRVDPATGDIAFADLADPEIDDVLDDLGTLALKMGGEVAILTSEQMPTETGIAAIYRY